MNKIFTAWRTEKVIKTRNARGIYPEWCAQGLVRTSLTDCYGVFGAYITAKTVSGNFVCQKIQYSSEKKLKILLRHSLLMKKEIHL